MATVNKASLRTEFGALKARFEALCANGKMSPEGRAAPTRVVAETRTAPVTECRACGRGLEGVAPAGTERRVRVDLVFETRELTVEAEIKTCPRCRTENRGAFPKEMPGPLTYGHGIVAFATHLLSAGLAQAHRADAQGPAQALPHAPHTGRKGTPQTPKTPQRTARPHRQVRRRKPPRSARPVRNRSAALCRRLLPHLQLPAVHGLPRLQPTHRDPDRAQR